MSEINYLAEILKDLNQHMEGQIQISENQPYTCIKTDEKNLIKLLKRLKQKHGFNYLANLTAVDYQDHFEVVYHIHSVPDNRKIMVKCSISREKAQLPSAVSLWPAADWQEREIYDLMGIKFTGHPNLVRILLPEDFTGHPLRKDYQIKG
jgi:NADH-quinone oxidoreductase subunit C